MAILCDIDNLMVNAVIHFVDVLVRVDFDADHSIQEDIAAHCRAKYPARACGA